MSYDLDLYVSKPTPLTAPDAGPNAQFGVESPARIEPEDIPATYAPLIARRRWLIRIHIEGAPTPETSAVFEAWLAVTLADTKGLVVDEQAGTWATAKKTGPLPGTASDDITEMGEMSFFLTDANAFHASGLAKMLDAIQATLPEAMPARFGQYEPFQGRVENGDTGPLLAAFADDPDQFLKALTPFAHIYLSLPCDAELTKWHPNHFLRKEVLVTRVAFELRPKAFEDPRLLDLFKAIASTIGVFYADLRRTEGPVRSWFWHGLPEGPVEAFCLGAPYTGLWPEAVSRGVPLANGVTLVAPTRTDPTVPKPPHDLADPGTDNGARLQGRAKYAPTFPFDIPDP